MRSRSASTSVGNIDEVQGNIDEVQGNIDEVQGNIDEVQVGGSRRPFTNREGRARLDLDKEIKTDHKFSKRSLRLNQR